MFFHPSAILQPPVNVSVSSINYKSVMISWSPITFPQPVISNATSSNDTVKNISALYVYYQESGKPVNQWQVIGIPPTMVSYNITDLKAYTDYEFYMVTGVTSGTGAASVKARFRTVEGGERKSFAMLYIHCNTYFTIVLNVVTH